MNKRLSAIVLLLVIWTAPTQAQVIIEGSLKTLDGQQSGLTLDVVPRQVIRMDWQLGSDSWFTSPPLMPDWQVDGAVILSSSEEQGNFSRRSGRTTFSGVNRYYWLVPEQPGNLTIAPHDVWLTRAHDTEARLHQTPVLNVRVKLPESASNSSVNNNTSFFPADDVSLSQSLSSIEGLKVGDQVVREVSVSARGTLGSLIPGLDALPESVSVQGYQASAEVTNHTEPRGRLTGGLRKEIWVYRFDESGTLTLPGVELQWWDLQNKQFKTVSLPSVTVEVASSVAGGEELRLRQSRFLFDPMFIAIISLLLVSAVCWYFRKTVARRFHHFVALFKSTLVSHPFWVSCLLLLTAVFGSSLSLQNGYLHWQRCNSLYLHDWPLPNSASLANRHRPARVCVLVRLMTVLQIQRWKHRQSRYLPDLND